MKRQLVWGALAFAALLTLATPLAPAAPRDFNGVGSYEPGNGHDAPIFRQFAFVEGVVTQYHVLSPEGLLTDSRKTDVYQFPLCSTLDPVMQKLPGHETGPLAGRDVDSPTRRIVNVVLSTGCSVQPKSEAEVMELALTVQPTNLWVNAPLLPKHMEEHSNERLFTAPPYRPRIDAWQEGEPRLFITYEASWYPLWAASSFPGNDADVFIISYGPTHRDGFSIHNAAVGTPNHQSVRAYSPIWKANCIVDAVNQKCMVSVNMQVPGYYQCKSVAECLTMVNDNTGEQVKVTHPPTFTHINCPMVAADLNGDDYIDATEEFVFPDLWVTGPVIA